MPITLEALQERLAQQAAALSAKTPALRETDWRRVVAEALEFGSFTAATESYGQHSGLQRITVRSLDDTVTEKLSNIRFNISRIVARGGETTLGLTGAGNDPLLLILVVLMTIRNVRELTRIRLSPQLSLVLLAAHKGSRESVINRRELKTSVATLARTNGLAVPSDRQLALSCSALKQLGCLADGPTPQSYRLSEVIDCQL